MPPPFRVGAISSRDAKIAFQVDAKIAMNDISVSSYYANRGYGGVEVEPLRDIIEIK